MSNLHIRQATEDDLDKIVSIEATCFPALEAATKISISERLSAYSKGFFVAEIDSEIIGFINGACADTPTIEDHYFESMTYHKDNAPILMVFGLDVHPDHQRKGYAKLLMSYFIDYAKSEKKEAVILTCKTHLISYYESFGYTNDGLSASSHGGAEWYDMTLKL